MRNEAQPNRVKDPDIGQTKRVDNNQFFEPMKAEVLTKAPLILVVQARTNVLRAKEEQNLVDALALKAGVRVRIINPLTESEHPWEDPKALMKGIDGVWFLGSADVDLTVDNASTRLYKERVYPLARYAKKEATQKRTHKRRPAFGSCLGAQTLNEANGGMVGRIKGRHETGTVPVNIIVEHPIFNGVQVNQTEEGELTTFIMNGHKDSTTRRARGFRILATTERDPLSITGRRDLIATAGHPEITNSNDLAIAIEVSNRKDDSDLERYVATHDIFDTPGSDMMVLNFFDLVKMRVEQRRARSVRRRNKTGATGVFSPVNS